MMPSVAELRPRRLIGSLAFHDSSSPGLRYLADRCANDHLTVGFAFEERWPFSGSRPFNGGTCRGVDSISIGAIDGHAGHSVGGRSYCQVVDGRRCADWAVLTVEIIFTDKHYRCFPHACHVQRFVKCPNIGRAIAEEGECNTRCAMQFGPTSPRPAPTGSPAPTMANEPISPREKSVRWHRARSAPYKRRSRDPLFRQRPLRDLSLVPAPGRVRDT